MKHAVTSFHKLLLCTSLCLVIIGSAGCSGLASRARHAALAAVHDPWTWGPLAGAAAVTLTGTDERISH